MTVTYRLSDNGNIIIRDGSTFIPADEANADYQEYLKWVSEGNTPEPEYSLEEYRVKVRKDIDRWRYDAINNPNSTVTVSDKEWQTGPISLNQLNNVITAYSSSGATPEGFEWRDANNVNHAADLALLVSIVTARQEEINAIWQYSWQLKTDLDAATTIEEMDAISWNPT